MRKSTPINPKATERLKLLLAINGGVSQTQLCERIGISQNTMSRIMNGKSPLTPYVAGEIVKCFPGTKYEWLMGETDFETESERISFICKNDSKRERLIEELIQLHGYTPAFETWDGKSCHLQYPPGISDEEALERIHNKQPEPIISVTAPSGGIRYLERCDYARIVKNIDDYIEMQLSFLFRKRKDAATEYWG